MKLKYVDHKPIILKLKGRDQALPRTDNIIDVDDGTAKRLLKMKNGNKKCFEKVQARKYNDEVKSEKKEPEETIKE